MRSHDKHPQRKMHHAKEEEFIKIHYQSLTVYVFDSHFRITLLVVRLRKKREKSAQPSFSAIWWNIKTGPGRKSCKEDLKKEEKSVQQFSVLISPASALPFKNGQKCQTNIVYAHISSFVRLLVTRSSSWIDRCDVSERIGLTERLPDEYY